jgi:hypothetical protein
MSGTANDYGNSVLAASRLWRLRERAADLRARNLPASQRTELRRALEAAWVQAAGRYRATADAAASAPPPADTSPARAHRKG